MQTVYLRVDETLKRAAEEKAKDAGLSLNEFMVQAMEAVLGVAPNAEERARFNIETTIGFITGRAVAGEVVSYLDVALANGFQRGEWPRARRLIAPHLYAVGRECNRRNLPMLTALVVSRDTGLPSEGLFELASQLGMTVADRDLFVRQKQAEVLAWAARISGGAERAENRFDSLRGIWRGPRGEELIAQTRGDADETYVGGDVR